MAAPEANAEASSSGADGRRFPREPRAEAPTCVRCVGGGYFRGLKVCFSGGILRLSRLNFRNVAESGHEVGELSDTGSPKSGGMGLGVFWGIPDKYE